jgi:hypothetical protein
MATGSANVSVGMTAKKKRTRNSEQVIRRRCDDIYGLVVDGQPLRVIRAFVRENLPWDAHDATLRRYVARCEKRFVEQSEPDRKAVKGRGHARLERLYARAAQKGDLRNALAIEEAILRLHCQLDDRPTVNLFVSPQWQEALQVVLVALEPYPEARISVADRLAELQS